jgi:hypothetical protein
MTKKESFVSRRDFIATTGVAVAGSVMLDPLSSFAKLADTKKMRIAIVGTGIRALGMWSKDVLETYSDRVEFVGLCDINPGRVESFKKLSGFT